MSLSKKIFIFGIDQAGKTVTTNFFTNQSTEQFYRPTLSFSIKDWDFHKIRFHLWDAPGQKNFRKIWIRGIDLADTLVFILDTADKERFHEAKYELDKIIEEIPENNAPLLFCFHKMDLPLAKENLSLAKKDFEKLDIKNHSRQNFQTSIKKPETLDRLAKEIAAIFEQS